MILSNIKITAVLLLLIALSLAGCTQPAPAPTLTPAPETAAVLPTDTLVPEVPTASPTNPPPTPTDISPPTETLAPMDTPAPTAVPSQPCLPVVPGLRLEQAPFEVYPSEILTYLNAGGSVNDLAVLLEAYGAASLPHTAQQADLNGDGWQDVVVSVVDTNSLLMIPGGVLVVYTCQDGQYQTEFVQPSADYFGAPAIIHIRDINADGLDELIVSSTSCGAHTCFEEMQIFSWMGEGFENRINGSTGEIPFPSVQLTDFDGDRVYQLELAGQGFGSVGAGPQREQTHIWVYQPDSGYWEFSEEVIGTSDYRIHRLHDADEAMNRGEYQVALLLYDQVFNDPNLLDWADPVTEQLNIGGYARYKMVVAYALTGDLATAEEFLRQMASVFPSNLPQISYFEMAQVYLQAFGTGNSEAACAAAQAYAESHAVTVLEPLGPLAFGYANREYTVEDVCP